MAATVEPFLNLSRRSLFRRDVGTMSSTKSSERLLRTISTLGGPSPALPHGQPALLHRAESTRLANRVAVEHTVGMHMMLTFGLSIAICSLITVGIFLAQCVCGILAVRAALDDWHGPCDVPLQQYAVAAFALFLCRGPVSQQLNQHFQQTFAGLTKWTYFVWWMVVDLPVMLLVTGSGVGLLRSSATCMSADPQTYWPVRHFVVLQCISCPLGYALTVGVMAALSWGLRRGLLSTGTGCARAVEALPRLPFDPDEFLDDDGDIAECPFCLVVFDETAEIVRTPCDHVFHRACLSRWCSNHRTCPLCLHMLGVADPPV